MLPSLLVLMNSKRRNLGSARGLNDAESDDLPFHGRAVCRSCLTVETASPVLLANGLNVSRLYNLIFLR